MLRHGQTCSFWISAMRPMLHTCLRYFSWMHRVRLCPHLSSFSFDSFSGQDAQCGRKSFPVSKHLKNVDSQLPRICRLIQHGNTTFSCRMVKVTCLPQPWFSMPGHARPCLSRLRPCCCSKCFCLVVMILLACVPSPDGYNFERSHAKLKYSENRLSALHLSTCWLAMLNEKPEEQTEYRAAGLQYCEDHQESGEVEVIWQLITGGTSFKMPRLSKWRSGRWPAGSYFMWMLKCLHLSYGFAVENSCAYEFAAL